MFVVTPEGVIATDPIGLGRPQAVTTYIDEIKKITPQPVKYVIYSHNHYDHITGGQPFKDLGARFIAHKNAKAQLERLQPPNIVMPDEVVDDAGRTLTLGGNVTCDATEPRPINGAKYFHFNQRIDSNDSFQRILDIVLE